MMDCMSSELGRRPELVLHRNYSAGRVRTGMKGLPTRAS
jgi:hypothetical protein